MAGLLDLPDELLRAILGRLPARPTLAAASRASRALRTAARGTRWATLEVPRGAAGLPGMVEALRRGDLAGGAEAVSAFADDDDDAGAMFRALAEAGRAGLRPSKIRIHAPSDEPLFEHAALLAGLGAAARRLELVLEGPSSGKARAGARAVALGAALPAVVELELARGGDEPDACPGLVAACAAAFPRLCSLSLAGAWVGEEALAAAASLASLRELRVRAAEWLDPSALFRGAAAAALETLELDCAAEIDARLLRVGAAPRLRRVACRALRLHLARPSPPLLAWGGGLECARVEVAGVPEGEGVPAERIAAAERWIRGLAAAGRPEVEVVGLAGASALRLLRAAAAAPAAAATPAEARAGRGDREIAIRASVDDPDDDDGGEAVRLLGRFVARARALGTRVRAEITTGPGPAKRMRLVERVAGELPASAALTLIGSDAGGEGWSLRF